MRVNISQMLSATLRAVGWVIITVGRQWVGFDPGWPGTSLYPSLWGQHQSSKAPEALVDSERGFGFYYLMWVNGEELSASQQGQRWSGSSTACCSWSIKTWSLQKISWLFRKTAHFQIDDRCWKLAMGFECFHGPQSDKTRCACLRS